MSGYTAGLGYLIIASVVIWVGVKRLWARIRD